LQPTQKRGSERRTRRGERKKFLPRGEFAYTPIILPDSVRLPLCVCAFDQHMVLLPDLTDVSSLHLMMDPTECVPVRWN